MGAWEILSSLSNLIIILPTGIVGVSVRIRIKKLIGSISLLQKISVYQLLKTADR